ncbi:hypothetical protein EJX00_13065, partial [Enterococcus faecium]|nr:hypothetical protein [Enterococcus faecium]
MKCKKMIATLMLSTSILGTLTTMVPTLAAENNQVVATATDQTKQGVNIPDANLKKALNRVLNQDENADITADQLATIQKLDIFNQGIASLEGLQYCLNLKKLRIGCGACEHKPNSNTISDLSPLVNLTQLTMVQTGGLSITDFSPLKFANLNPNQGPNLSSNLGTIDIKPNADGTVTFKNPFVGLGGTSMLPFSLKSSAIDFCGGSYDKNTNTITWSKEAFENNSYSENGYRYIDLFFDDVDGNSDFSVNASVILRVNFDDLNEQENTEQTIDFHGVGTWAGKDTHFAQLKYNGDHTATLQSGIEMYGCQVHPSFEGVYASILAKDKDGNPLFTKEFKGTDWVQTKEENFNLPENATLTIYHAEGNSGRLASNDDQSLKQQ